MKKIPTLFVRDEKTHLVTPQVNPDCQWVLEGLGVATVKVDGSCCMVRDGVLYRRYTPKVALTRQDADLMGFIQSSDEGEALQGWLPVGASPEDRYHREAWENCYIKPPNGTYELIGPKVQGNPYKLSKHQLWTHDYTILYDVPCSFDELKQHLPQFTGEGIVWWRDMTDLNCEKCKIKRRDFGLPWPIK